LGMAQYEVRSWVGWHHHMTLVGLAHLFVTLARRRLKKSPGADAGPDGAVARGRVGRAAVAVGSGHRARGLPRAAERRSPEVVREDLAGQAPGRQNPAAVELVVVPLARFQVFSKVHPFRIATNFPNQGSIRRPLPESQDLNTKGLSPSSFPAGMRTT